MRSPRLSGLELPASLAIATLRSDDLENLDDIPEEVAVAYVTYQSAKNRYRDQVRNRGYQGHGNAEAGTSGNTAGKQGRGDESSARDEKIRLMKSRSFCSSCGKKGHWHKDKECPNNNSGASADGPKDVKMCNIMPAQVLALRHVGGGDHLLAIADTASARTVAGTQWVQDYIDKFGTGKIMYSSFYVVISFVLAQKVVRLRTSVINGDIPLSVSRTVLSKLGMIYDIEQGTADFTKVGLSGFELMSTASGHPAIPIIPVVVDGGKDSVLPVEEPRLESREPYTAFAVGFNSRVEHMYNIYHDKKLVAISKMTKTQLLEEALRLGLTVHKSWSPEEIKAIIMEHRVAQNEKDATVAMKKVSQLTLPELKKKAQSLDIDFPATITKGNLLRLVRDSLNTPDNELMKIGRYRGREFREFARWFENKQRENKGVWEENLPTRAVNMGERPTRDRPKRPTVETDSAYLEKDMDDEPDADTLAEIETEGVCCGDPAVLGSGVVWETDFVRGNYTQASVYAVDDHKGGVEGMSNGEAVAKEAYRSGDFTYDKLMMVLTAADFKPRRNDRGVSFADEDGAKDLGYYTFGLFTHGGIQGITKLTIEKSHLCRYVNAFARHHLGTGATWTSFTLSRDVKTGIHHDFNNLPGALNHSCSFGQKKGGFLWLEDRDLDEDQCHQEGVVWKRTKDKSWLPGMYHDTYHKFVSFVGKEIVDYLKKVGCSVPRARAKVEGTSTERGQKLPKKSIRKSLAHSAVKLTLLLSTMISAASSFLTEALPHAVHDPIVIFELGGTDATYEAVELDKSVMEPMGWEEFDDPDKVSNAFDIVQGITPNELRINLGRMPEHLFDVVVELSRDQITGGGDVVVRGDDIEKFKERFADYQKYVHCDVHGDQWGIFGKRRGHYDRNNTVSPLDFRALCDGYTRTSDTRGPRMLDFNDCVGVDILYHHDADDQKWSFLSMVDWGTSYHIVVPLYGHSAEDIEEVFNNHWVTPFGPPSTVSVDLEGGVQKGLRRLCDWHSITVKNVGTQAHWQAGITERQGAWWKNIWDRVCHEMTIVEAEIELAATLVSTDAKFQRAQAIRASAKVAFHHSEADSRFRKALLHRARSTTRPFDHGEPVHYWFKPKDRRRGRWAGPAVVVGREGDNYWISRGGRCRLTAPEHLRPSGPEEVGEFFRLKGAQQEVEKLVQADFDAEETFDFEEPDADMAADDHLSDYWPSDHEGVDHPVELPEMSDMELDHEDGGELLPAPVRRLKRKTNPTEGENAGTIARRRPPPQDGEAEVFMMKRDLTQHGVEKRQEKELRWAEIPDDVKEKFKEAEAQQWEEHLSYDALEPLDIDESNRVRREVSPDRILRSRWAYKDKNWAKRKQGEDLPWKCKSRLVIAGHQDPDLGVAGITTDAPTLSRPGLLCLLQVLANGVQNTDPWEAAAGDIRCAFLNGGYLQRDQELYLLHQPSTGFAGLHPDQLVRVKKNVFGLATSPHGWWLDLQGGIKGEFRDEKFVGKPIGYVGTHVDDLLVVAPRSVKKAICEALSRTFPVDSWEERAFSYVGTEISYDENGAYLNQQSYVESRLFTVNIPKGASEDAPADAEALADNRSLIGALSWVSAQSRPDITCAVSMSQQLQKAPTYGDVKFTNSTAAKAGDHKQRGLVFRPVSEDKAVFLTYHDAAWANAYEGEFDEDDFKLYPEDLEAGLQRDGPPSHQKGRKAKRNNSKVASQLGELILLGADDCFTKGGGYVSVLDWKSRAGQRVCRSTFSAETQACIEGLEGAQYIRACYETILSGEMTKVEDAKTPLVCLSDCRSLFDHLHRQGVPRTPSDRRLAVDLAALRQALKAEKWSEKLPLAWIPSEIQLGDVLTKPQDPTPWWDMITKKVFLPISVVGTRAETSTRTDKERKTSVKPCGNPAVYDYRILQF
ncbi:GIP [Symbiodinium sp. CCMP2592]|nr:GIP [Symbiodinium sp. CCMP2592]